MITETYISIGILLLGIAMSALYSGLETGLYTINQIRLEVKANAGWANAKRMIITLRNPTRMLAVLLVSNNIANFIASYGAARLLNATELGPWESIGINALVMIPLLFIFGEVLPKDLFRSHTDHLTYRWSGTFNFTDKLLWWTGVVPLVASIGKLARWVLGSESGLEPTPRRRFGLLFKEGLEGGVLSDEQITLAERALAMKSLTVKSEMVPWVRVACINANVSIGRRTAAVRNMPHTRLPVVNQNGVVRGVLPVLNALLNPQATTESLLLKPIFMSPETPVRVALQQLRESGSHMAIVTGPRNAPAGIITLKDLVEPLVGELGAW